MSCHRQRSKCAKVPSVLERDQAEGYDDQKNGLLVDVIAEQEGRVSAQSHSADKVVPSCLGEELHQGRKHGGYGENGAHSGRNLGQNCEGCVSDQASSDAVQCLRLYGEAEMGGDC